MHKRSGQVDKSTSLLQSAEEDRKRDLEGEWSVPHHHGNSTHGEAT